LVEGAPERLTNGTDIRAEICGIGDKLIDKPYVYFSNPIRDINVHWCTDKCPDNTV